MQGAAIFFLILACVLLFWVALSLDRLSQRNVRRHPRCELGPEEGTSGRKRFSDGELAAIEAYLLGRKKRSRDLALLFLLHETDLSLGEIACLKLHEEDHAGADGDDCPRCTVSSNGMVLALSPQATRYLSQWVSERGPVGGVLLFGQKRSGKPMAIRQIKDLAREWRSRSQSK